MANIMDYLKWRGDLLFTQDPPNAVDALIFSTISYLKFAGKIQNEPNTPIELREATEEFLSLEDVMQRGRNKNDIDLFRVAAETNRFGHVKICKFQDRLIPQQDTQFAAITFLLDDDSVMIAFRGTDNTLVGWKEDFNMCFQQTVPAQRLAVQYVREVFAEYSKPMRLCGHSKGGNMAVFSAARSSPMIQEWILDVYNNDGPGFSDYMMGDPGYLAMVPKIHTYVPQSSLIGMIMEREEEYTIIRSSQLSIMQHDTFSWEVEGKELKRAEKLTADSQLFNKAIDNWLAGMTTVERNQMVDTLFDLLEDDSIEAVGEIFSMKSIRNYAKKIGSNELARKILSDDFIALLNSARKSIERVDHKKLHSGEQKTFE